MAPVHVIERSGAAMGSLPKLGREGEATYIWGCGGNALTLSLSWSYTFWTSVVYFVILSWRELLPLFNLLRIKAKLFSATPGKSPNINVELLMTLKTRPTATKVDCPSKTSIASSSKNPWSDKVVILKLLLDCLVTVFGVNFTDVL